MADFDTKFGTGNQDWETPDSIFTALNGEFQFTLDVCASTNNAKCSAFFSKEEDGLSQKWQGVCWMNPPFGEVGTWIKKAYTEAINGTTVVCFVAAKTNTNWWHDFCMNALEIRLLQGRPKFKGCKHGLPQPLAIVVFDSKIPATPKLTSWDIRQLSW